MSQVNGPKINIELAISARTEELKQAIRDFKDTKISLGELEQKTKDLNSATGTLNSAYRALNQTSRVNNFELRNFATTLRAVQTISRDYVQIQQLLNLQGIQNNQVTAQQQQTFEDLSASLDILFNNFAILGPNSDFQKAFSDFVGKADDLSSVQLQDLIDQAAGLKASLSIEPEKAAALGDFIDKLKDLKKQAITKEEAKNTQDMMNALAGGANIAADIGLIATNLEKYKGSLASMVTFVGANAGPLAAIVLLLYGKQIAEQVGLLQYAGDVEVDTIKPGAIDPSTNKPYNLKPGANGIVPDQGQYPSVLEMKINMYDTNIRSDEDLAKLATFIGDKMERLRAMQKK